MLTLDQPDEAIVNEKFLQRALWMLKNAEEKIRKRKKTLITAAWNGWVDQYSGALLRVLYGHPPAPVRSMISHRKPEAGVVRARPRVNSATMTAWLPGYPGQNETAGRLFGNPDVTSWNVAMAEPKGSRFQMVARYRTLNQFFKQAAMSMQRLENLRMLRGRSCSAL